MHCGVIYFLVVLYSVNPFPAVPVVLYTRPGMVPRVAGRPPTAPVTPAHRSKASGGRDLVSPRGPQRVTVSAVALCKYSCIVFTLYLHCIYSCQLSFHRYVYP